MHSWEIVAVDVDEHSEYDDPRAIERLGYIVAGSLKTSEVDAVCLKMESDLSGYHVVHDGRRIDTQSVVADDRQYIRTADEDRADDPLLELPSIEKWKGEKRLSGI